MTARLPHHLKHPSATGPTTIPVPAAPQAPSTPPLPRRNSMRHLRSRRHAATAATTTSSSSSSSSSSSTSSSSTASASGSSVGSADAWPDLAPLWADDAAPPLVRQVLRQDWERELGSPRTRGIARRRLWAADEPPRRWLPAIDEFECDERLR